VEREVLTDELFGTAVRGPARRVVDSGGTLEVVRDLCAEHAAGALVQRGRS
jgi:hypothetical protein